MGQRIDHLTRELENVDELNLHLEEDKVELIHLKTELRSQLNSYKDENSHHLPTITRLELEVQDLQAEKKKTLARKDTHGAKLRTAEKDLCTPQMNLRKEENYLRTAQTELHKAQTNLQTTQTDLLKTQSNLHTARTNTDEILKTNRLVLKDNKDKIIVLYKGQFGEVSNNALDQLFDAQCKVAELASKHEDVEETLCLIIIVKEESEKKMSEELKESREKLEKSHQQLEQSKADRDAYAGKV